MSLEYKVVNSFKSERAWSRISPHPERLKKGLPQCWRFHVEGNKEIFLIDSYFVEGQATEKNNYNQYDLQSSTGMTAWLRFFGDVNLVTTNEGKVAVKITLKEPN